MPARQTVRWKSACLLLASALLAACVSTPQRSERRDLRLDTETAGRIRHATGAAAKGARSLAPGASREVASTLARTVPLLLVLLESDNAVGEFEERLVECARQAERQVNSTSFGNRAPTRQECGEEVEVDGCSKPITRAMLLGQQKHVLALQCAQEVLEQLWPAPVSLEQRYRYYPSTRFLETVSREEEARLIAQGCTRELWRTIKPDIVLHADRNWRRSALTLDFKFPCPDTNDPRWTRYGESSAYAGSTQGEIYKAALGGEPLIISPRGVTP
ncbi:hypothetical protein [Hyalangium sp.]|uniref:hypothetical protein n=1 Tax=Hyalangium sp. TaxID=2028555 RepID=UPI002D371C8C|nr:hypothetical protein [Hyalangium sp.]HYI03126.1 hypothetical protein [Hyalangium sp.]